MPKRPRPMAELIADDDAVAHADLDPMRYGRRFSMDVSEDLLQQGGKEALAHAFTKLMDHIARQQQPELEREARAWMTSEEHRYEMDILVRTVVAETVRQWALDSMESSPFGQEIKAMARRIWPQ